MLSTDPFWLSTAVFMGSLLRLARRGNNIRYSRIANIKRITCQNVAYLATIVAL